MSKMTVCDLLPTTGSEKSIPTLRIAKQVRRSWILQPMFTNLGAIPLFAMNKVRVQPHTVNHKFGGPELLRLCRISLPED